MLEGLAAVPAAPSAAVMITSDKCYENVEWVYGYRETDRLINKDPYSASKAAAEMAIHNLVPVVVLVAGFAPHPGRSGARRQRDWRGRLGGQLDIVPDAVRAWSESRPVVNIRSPNATRPWQHVLEPLSGYLLAGAGA